MPWFQFTMRRLMVYVAIVAVFLWGCMGVSQNRPYHHFAIVLAVVAAFADLGFAITYERAASESSVGGDPEESTRP